MCYDEAGKSQDDCSGDLKLFEWSAFGPDSSAFGLLKVAVVGVEGNDISRVVGELDGDEFWAKGHPIYQLLQKSINLFLTPLIMKEPDFLKLLVIKGSWSFEEGFEEFKFFIDENSK